MVCGLLLNAIALGSASQQSPKPEHLAPDVLALEREIESAVVRRDRTFLETALANDFALPMVTRGLLAGRRVGSTTRLRGCQPSTGDNSSLAMLTLKMPSHMGVSF